MKEYSFLGVSLELTADGVEAAHLICDLQILRSISYLD
jgi:hypothetical protein